MRLPIVDCRSLIEFCKAFEQHRNMVNSSARSCNRPNHANSHGSSKKHINPFCEHSLLAVVDLVLLLLILGSLGFLTAPYFKIVVHEAYKAIPTVLNLLGEVIREAPVAYMVGLLLAFVIVISGIAVWEFLEMQSRKCRNPNCRGLRKAVEFDIQLESEECVKHLPSTSAIGRRVEPLELGDDHKELEAELKRMAPLNGRTVLIFRAPCGCPAGRLEVWGPKKIRKIKK